MSDILTHKRCNKCGEVKPVSEFYRKGKNGYRHQCKPCNKKYAQGYFKAHMQEFLERYHNWVSKNADAQKQMAHKSYVLNKDKVRERSKLWLANHPEKVNEWARKNPERHKELVKQWDATHRDAKNMHAQARRAKVRSVGGVITPQEWSDLKSRYNYTCLCCGKREPEIKLTLDHVQPIALGGMNVIENAQPLCKPCNSSKNIKWIDFR